MRVLVIVTAAVVLLSAIANACPVACPLNYAPVCLDNGETAGNECAAKCANATIKCQGECPCKGTQGGLLDGLFDGLFGADIRDVPYQCYADPDPGPCRAFFQRYAYNYTSGKCEQFVFGGCQGNYNNFKSLDECNNVCVEPEPKWRCQPACIGQPQCQNNLVCANATCNPVYGFLQAKPLVLDVNSWQYGPGGNHQPAVSNAQACCNKCRSTKDCNVWSYCANPDGCGSNCTRPTGPNPTDQSLTVGPFGGCKPNGAFMPGTCRLGFAPDLNVTEVIVPDTNWTSGVVEEKFDFADGLAVNLTSASV